MSHSTSPIEHADAPEEGEGALTHAHAHDHEGEARTHGDEPESSAVRARRLRVSRETRIGIAALLSFLILVTVMVINRERLSGGGKAESVSGTRKNTPPNLSIDPAAGRSKVKLASHEKLETPDAKPTDPAAVPTPKPAETPTPTPAVAETVPKPAPIDPSLVAIADKDASVPTPAPEPAPDPAKNEPPLATPTADAPTPAPAPTPEPTPAAPTTTTDTPLPAPAPATDSTAPVAVQEVPVPAPAETVVTPPATAEAPVPIPAPMTEPQGNTPVATQTPAPVTSPVAESTPRPEPSNTTPAAAPVVVQPAPAEPVVVQPAPVEPVVSPTPSPAAASATNLPPLTPAPAVADTAPKPSPAPEMPADTSTWVALPNLGKGRALDDEDRLAPAPPPEPTNSREAFSPVPERVATATATAAAAAPITAAARSRPVESDTVEPVSHVVQRGENFWTISRQYYGWGRFWKALWAANRATVPAPEQLYVGQTIRIPPPEDLDRSLVEPERPARATSTASATPTLRKASRPAAQSAPVAAASKKGEVAVELPTSDPFARQPVEDTPKPVAGEADDDAPAPTPARQRIRYKVKPYETLRSIARDTLGDPRRADEILDLNSKNIDDPVHLTPGQVIALPSDAEVSFAPSRPGR
jgi:nucleoid-associated protein YgaU